MSFSYDLESKRKKNVSQRSQQSIESHIEDRELNKFSVL